MSFKFVVKSLPTVFFQRSLETQKCKQKNSKNAINISSPAMCTLVEELSNCYDYFLRLSGSIWKSIFITFKFPNLHFSTTSLQE